MALLPYIKGRASQAAGANTETQPGSVVKLYPDDLGNVIAADVRLNGQPRIMRKIPNGSGIRLWNNAPVTINWSQGNRHDPIIIGVSGAEAGADVQTATGSGSTSSGSTTSSVDVSTAAVLMLSPDDGFPNAYAVVQGANVSFDAVDPVVGGLEDDPVGGALTISVFPLVATELPSTSGLLEGTCLDLVTGDGDPDGMFRLSAGVWVRRDTPGEGAGGSGISTADRTRWNNAGTDATEALSDAAQAEADAQTAITAAAAAQSTANTAQTEITNARTRDAVGAFSAQTFGNLKAHLGALWSQIATLKTWIADPTGITVGWILTRTSGGVAWAAPTGGSGGSGTGTVTSVDGSGGSTGLTLLGGPITDEGTLTLGGTLALASGGTGATTAAAARTNLGAAPLAWTILELTAVASTLPEDDPTL